MKLVLVCLIVSTVLMSAQAGNYVGRPGRPGTGGGRRPCQFGSVGICGGFVNAQCPPGSYCQMFTPSSSAGDCCRNRPGHPRPRPRPGTGQCPPPSGLAGICVFDPNRNCLGDEFCPRGQRCCPEGCGSVCMPVVGY